MPTRSLFRSPALAHHGARQWQCLLVTLPLVLGTMPALAQQPIVAHGVAPSGAPAAPRTAATAQPAAANAQPAGEDADHIVAVVNGAVISRSDVDNRERLFALSTGLSTQPDVLDRLTPQVTRSLIDEKLQLQEMQRRKIVITDAEIASALAEIEQRNGMPAGALRTSLAGHDIALRTLIDQLRVQIGWVRVLRDQLGNNAQVGDAEIADRIASIQAQTGKPEYRVSEIFIPVDVPSHEADAERFAETVIGQLRAGAPFPVVAAQFSASQTALEGGDLGWVRPEQLDPGVAKLVTDMPPGAISQPVRVAGGFSIVSLRAKREIGHDPATMVRIRQVFLPFATPLDPTHPTPQQQASLQKAQGLSNTVKSCDEMEAANKANGAARPSDPGDLRVESIPTPGLRQILAQQPVGKTTAPLVANDGIAVLIVCSRETVNAAAPAKQEIAQQMVAERAELASRQLIADLRRRALIDHRSS